MLPEQWIDKRLITRTYPVTGVAATHTPQTLRIDLKAAASKEVISNLFVRVRGNITIAGAGAGAATGRENPEALIRSITARSTPSLGIVTKNALTARGIVVQGIFDRGYAIRAADVADAAGVVAVDFFLPLVFKMPGSANPIEWSLPMAAFSSFELAIDCGGRQELFTGGVNTWDLTGLTVEIYADLDDNVRGEEGQSPAFHVFEEFETIVPVTITQTDLQYELQAGFFYTHLLLIAERDDVLVNDILNNVALESSGRSWLQPGDANALFIQRWNRETHVNNAAEVLTGLYFIPALRDGMFTR